jgi:hypothetical protein
MEPVIVIQTGHGMSSSRKTSRPGIELPYVENAEVQSSNMFCIQGWLTCLLQACRTACDCHVFDPNPHAS